MLSSPTLRIGILVRAALAAALCLFLTSHSPNPQVPRPPNILFIAVDDLNDWIEPLGGHPQAITPNLRALAESSVTFRRNYTASPACNPSRTALLTGMHTYRTGVYSNDQYWREALPDATTLPRYFSQNGYWSAGAGKIFHNDQPDPQSWDAYFPSKEKHMPDYFWPSSRTVNMPPFRYMYGDFDWSPIDIPDEETGDYSSVNWIIRQLGREHERPFFLAAGLYRPHLPWYVPKEYFDLYPLDSVQLPATLEDDVADLSARALEIVTRGGNYHSHVLEADQWKKAVQGYLASISYADAMVGRLLKALDESPHAQNTIVVLWSDHGWQLGEKRHWRKFALWENVARSVFMIRVPEEASAALPGGSATGGATDRVTSLIDIFPTLIELAGLSQKSGLDGRSLVPLLGDPAAPWPYAAITTYEYSEYSVRTECWRYIRYIDGSQELYDHLVDPEEWTNLAGRTEYQEVIREMASHIPADPAPLVETFYPIAPHRTPPLRSLEHYLDLKGQ